MSYMNNAIIAPHRAIKYLKKPSLAWRKAPPVLKDSDQIRLRLAISDKVSVSETRLFYTYARTNWVSLSHKVDRNSTIWPDFEKLVTENWQKDPKLMPWIAGKIKNLGTKAFSWAVYQGHLGMLDLGVTLCRPKMSAPLSDYDEMLPCHLAAKRGHLQVLIRLKAIEGLSRPMPCPRTGRGEIHYAAEQDQSAIVDFLVQSDPSLILSKGNDGRTPLHIAIIAGSLATIDLVTKLTRKEFWDTETVDTLLVAIEIGGFSLEVMSRVLQRMTTLLPSCRETVLGWVIKHDLAAAVSILVDCRVNLDSRLFEADAVVGRSRKDGDGQRYPALFFALEKSDPALATALVMNGTRLNTFLWLDQMGTPRSGVGRIDAIDIALCRRWTDLALLFRPIQIPDVSNETLGLGRH
ncbi:hypothetical protein E4T38_05291 [Aureobasidium subglaciale]|nr:hypothetical protein E4T38_05291 [Aureobasidium subglaciale]KAI5221805.1 hypothetical protein E4T40_05224 [Aureobasidium subglaciale]KAI5225827.1 hypothetical protein E4T41_05043 [Aureobasidium subglaciale]KAI5261559.1 hypothetical protein E4T46_04936 [Aureobasidium subglaciale]